MVDLFTVTRNASAVSGFLSEDLGKVLSSLELDAAKEGWRKSQLAHDARSQLWSVVNHLETAEVSATKSLNSLRENLSFYAYDCAHAKRNYILIVMAII